MLEGKTYLLVELPTDLGIHLQCNVLMSLGTIERGPSEHSARGPDHGLVLKLLTYTTSVLVKSF